jgi:hypothetical protein
LDWQFHQEDKDPRRRRAGQGINLTGHTAASVNVGMMQELKVFFSVSLSLLSVPARVHTLSKDF